MFAKQADPLSEPFLPRHLGPSDADIAEMLAVLGCASLDELSDAVVPAEIRLRRPLALEPPRSEKELLAALQQMAGKNQLDRSFLGMGYSGCVMPAVIRRNILENPGWYTAYTPYQAEISQGRLEMLVTFQTLISDLTALAVANASLLDEATAAAEAMNMCRAIAGATAPAGFFVAADCHPQTIAVLKTRARAAGIPLQIGSVKDLDFAANPVFAMLVQYPTTDGRVIDFAGLFDRARRAGVLVCVAADPLALCLLRPPGEMGADISIGSTQRFGVPLGYGGPHAAFLATRHQYVRYIPGRIVGISRDSAGRVGYRLALQTREQHIRRDRATSNICTAQVLLAILATAYAIFHGPDGLRRIARRVHALTAALAEGLKRLHYDVGGGHFFDTLRVALDPGQGEAILGRARQRRMNLRRYENGDLGIALDETTDVADLEDLLAVFAGAAKPPPAQELAAAADPEFPPPVARQGDLLRHETFHRYRAEHEFLRYLHRLQSRDLALDTSMIPLGSCTMKLNAAAEMTPVSWPEFANLHPFVPREQARGYLELFSQLEAWLAEITGFAAVSLQPNSGAQGEFAGLLVIRAFHEARGDTGRDVCLIPVSAHGTNPASAVMAGFRVVPIECDVQGNIRLEDLRGKAALHRNELAALMITYPSTHGVFERDVTEICSVVHEYGGRVYLDGANMNAQVGLCRPGDYGADVCHLNLHKTFCIPHGGGGPGMGPIAVSKELAPYLPGHPFAEGASATASGAVAAAPYGSPGILPISWMYIALMGSPGLTRASQVAILNANYMVRRLESDYDILFRGQRGWVAHEFIIDCRPFKKTAGITVDDIAKRLMDFGFHAPTMSFPVPGTLMIEPTESESKAELDRFCAALLAIRGEIRAVQEGRLDRDDNPLKNAPHPAAAVCGDDWTHPYSRQQAAFPAPWQGEYKYWPPLARIDNAYGDRNLVCTWRRAAGSDGGHGDAGS